MEWGAAIEVNGVRPAWIIDTIEVPTRHETDWYFGAHVPQTLTDDPIVWSGVTAIRLPAGHFVYTVLRWNVEHPDAVPFEPWAGGDAAPTDWDEGEVLCRDGHRYDGVIAYWSHDGGRAARPLPSPSDVIGYRKRREAASPAIGTRVRHPDEGEGTVIGNWEVRFDRKPYASEGRLLTFAGAARERLMVIVDTVTLPRMTEAQAKDRARRFGYTDEREAQQHYIGALYDLGLIRQETRAEQFARETGHEVTPAVEAALAWDRAA